jgi:MoxR-like ATPase
MLTHVRKINQKELKNIYNYGIKNKANVLVIGPSGSGKTEIAIQVADDNDCELIYINLSVLERTDFQGMPVISDDKMSVTYATPEFLPFSDVKTRNERFFLNTVLSWLSKQEIVDKSAMDLVKQRIHQIDDIATTKLLKQSLPYISTLKTKSLAEKISDMPLPRDDKKPIVILFDEVDKGAHEVLQVLLEFLQFRSVNGRAMNVQTCFLTGNLPDEFANSSQISHAITKRCMTFRLDPDFKIWREWAYNNNVHAYVLGFLSQHSDYMHKGPPDGDPTAYALPSARTWVAASNALTFVDKNKDSFNMREDELHSFKMTLVAGSVGDMTAIEFNNWIKYYKEMDPIVEKLIETGKFPDKDKLDVQQIFIVALSACSRIYAELKPNNEAVIKKYAKNTFVWLGTLQTDVQIGTIRMAFGGDFNKIKEYKLSNISELVDVFKNIKKLVNDTDI